MLYAIQHNVWVARHPEVAQDLLILTSFYKEIPHQVYLPQVGAE